MNDTEKVQMQQPDLPLDIMAAVKREAEKRRWTLASAYNYAIENGIRQYKITNVQIPIMTRRRPYERLGTLTKVDPETKRYIEEVCKKQNVYVADFIRWAFDVTYN